MIAQRTRVKFCGFTRAEDVQAAVQLGVDAVGLIATARSRRYVDPPLALRLRRGVPSFVSVVLLVMDPHAEELQRLLTLLHPDLIQFHGSETAEFCARFRWPYLKALAGGGGVDLLSSAQEFGSATGLVLDAHEPGAAGGTGRTFDWSTIPQDLRARCILSGGLDASTATKAIAQIGPHALDVASGIEVAPGIKCSERMQQFMQAVQAADLLKVRSL